MIKTSLYDKKALAALLQKIEKSMNKIDKGIKAVKDLIP